VNFSGQERKRFPVKTGKYFRSGPASVRSLRFYSEVEPIEVGLSKSPLSYFEQVSRLKLIEVCSDAAVRGAHIICEFDLAGVTRVVVPGIFKKHRVGELGADGETLLCQNKIWNLGEAVARDRIGANNFNVSLLDNLADVSRRVELHATIICC
jgi:hypothetical protein